MKKAVRKLTVVAFGIILGLNLVHLVINNGIGTFSQVTSLISLIAIVLLSVDNITKELALGTVSALLSMSLTVTFGGMSTTTLIIIDTIAIIVFGVVIILKNKGEKKKQQNQN